MNSKMDSSVARVAADGFISSGSAGATPDFEAEIAAAFKDPSTETLKAIDDSKSMSKKEPNFEQIQ